MKTGRDFSVGILRGGRALNSASSALVASLLDWIRALKGERWLCTAADGPPEEASCEDQKIWTVLSFKHSGRIFKMYCAIILSFCRRHANDFSADAIQPRRLHSSSFLFLNI